MITTYKDKPIVLRGLFDSAIHAALQTFVDVDCKELNLNSDLDQPDSLKKFHRRSLHNPQFLVSIHHQLTDFAGELFGVDVKPSYVFLSMYESGGQCYLHRDRDQCRFTIDYLISQEQSDCWAITISDQMSEHEVSAHLKRDVDSVEEMSDIFVSHEWNSCYLKPNDAVCYSGTHSWHYRPTRSAGRVNLAFFHFVEKDWNGSLD